jgi:hypothetical protein
MPRVNVAYDPERPVLCSWSLPTALAAEIEQRAAAGGIEPQELVRDLFLAHLPEFVADSLAETLALLHSEQRTEAVDSS